MNAIIPLLAILFGGISSTALFWILTAIANGHPRGFQYEENRSHWWFCATLCFAIGVIATAVVVFNRP